MSAIQASLQVQAPIETVFAVLSDFASYPEFMPETKEVKIESKKGNSLRATFTISVVKKIHYTLDIQLKPPREIRWSLVRGDFMKSNDGGWKLKAKKDGSTQADYEIAIGLSALVPKGVVDKLIASNLPIMMRAFQDRIEEKG